MSTTSATSPLSSSSLISADTPTNPVYSPLSPFSPLSPSSYSLSRTSSTEWAIGHSTSLPTRTAPGPSRHRPVRPRWSGVMEWQRALRNSAVVGGPSSLPLTRGLSPCLLSPSCCRAWHSPPSSPSVSHTWMTMQRTNHQSTSVSSLTDTPR